MAEARILLERRGDVATLRLNRPRVRNCIDGGTIAELQERLLAIRDDRAIRAVVVTAVGSTFCAGADLAYVKSLREPDSMRRFLEQWHTAFDALAALDRPTIAAVRGYALAGGLELLLACDLVVLSDTAVLGDQHANYGLVAGGGGSQRLPRQIGVRRAKELFFTGRRLSPQQAVEFGLANEVVAEADLETRVAALAAEIAAKSPVAAATIKRLVERGMETELGKALRIEIDEVIRHFQSEDAQEGLASFEEKRTPRFRGA